ncbi:MAG: hypothetical protein L0Y58_12935 [Verrucomicrobia subdivision 3 bacterium]|nr:hypothetical protein [Limisphaerales bacterium]
MKHRFRPTSCTVWLLLVVLLAARAGPLGPLDHGRQTAPDLLAQPIASLSLKGEFLLEGIAKLDSLTTGVGFSVELVPGSDTAGPPPSPRFSAEVTDVTLREALDWLCSLDKRYTWEQDRTTVNVFPRESGDDPRYFFNYPVTEIRFDDVANAYDAVRVAMRSLRGPAPRLVSWTGHDSANFAKPWTTGIAGVSVRQLFNRIAQQLGPEYGWIVSGNAKVRLFNFHAQLEPTTPRKSGT